MEVLLKSLFYIGRKLGHIVQVKNIGNTTTFDTSKDFFPLHYYVTATLLHSATLRRSGSYVNRMWGGGLNSTGSQWVPVIKVYEKIPDAITVEAAARKQNYARLSL
jgi:hypothetical protein